MSEFLRILDRYPYKCNIKGSHTMANWTKVYITSNHAVEKWYDKNLDAVTRRITKYVDPEKV